MLGTNELIIIGVILCGFFLLSLLTEFIFGGTVLRIIMRFSERKFFQYAVKTPHEYLQNEIYFPFAPLRKVLLLILLLQLIIFSLLSLSFFYALGESSSLHFLFRSFLLIFRVATFFCIGYSLLIHLQPNLKREKKYNFLLFGTMISSACATASEAMKAIITFNFLIEWFITNILFIIFIFVIGVLLTKFIKFNLAQGLPYPHPILRQTYSIIRLLGLIVISLIIIPNPISNYSIFYYFLIIYLLFRYLLTEYMQVFPIVYLRSFHYKESSEVFANLISLEASQFGMIIGLVHEKQKGSDIFGATNILNQGQTFTISDELWQEWVLDKLKRCSAVIIDSSVGSESVHWEVVTANKLVDPSRIIILQREGTESEVTSGNKQLVYALNSKSLKEARRSFRKILKDIFAESPEQIKKSVNAKKNN